MKVAISAQGQVPENKLDPRFGRCAYFIIFNTEDGSYKTIENTAANASGGAGSAAAQLVNKAGAEAVVSGNYGPNAVTALNSFGIKMYLAEEETVWIVIDKFKNGVLAQAETATVPGKHSK